VFHFQFLFVEPELEHASEIEKKYLPRFPRITVTGQTAGNAEAICEAIIYSNNYFLK